MRILVGGYFTSISRKEAVLFQRRILHAILMICAAGYRRRAAFARSKAMP